MTKQLAENIENLPLPWYAIKGENREEAIDLRFVISFSANFSVIFGSDTPNVNVHFFTKGNHEYQTDLTMQTYNDFLKKLRLCNDMRMGKE